MSRASAPGKVLWCGEYAVLEDAPALVSAVGPRARVTLRCGSGRFFSPQIHSSPVPYAWEGEAVRWACEARLHRRLALARALLEGLGREPADIEAETGEFQLQGAKLGLGSSAALSVAWVAAALKNSEPARVAALAGRIHLAFQGGRGSGADVAASAYGGLLAFRRGSAPAALPWPAGLGRMLVWTGRSADTREFLRGLAAWRDRWGRGYATVMERLKDLAEAAVSACAAGEGRQLLDAMAAYAEELQGLGLAAGLQIYGSAHWRIAELARRAGVVYKPSGAGGGDCGVALSEDREALAGFAAKVAAEGARVLDVELDVDGVRLEADPEP